LVRAATPNAEEVQQGAHYRKHQEPKEEEIGDAGRRRRDARKAEYGGEQRNYNRNDCIAKHGDLFCLRSVPGKGHPLSKALGCEGNVRIGHAMSFKARRISLPSSPKRERGAPTSPGGSERDNAVEREGELLERDVV
jgi:hypothetical protein